ncbi:L-ascorbate metabolism protein UlaG, beta-lactamase superfamily [Catalinimonas alkaloidigena]|uniref:L-ascorbate metabolism protein UlaG, beta-lactamase superfamily n=1 Tax=Catalinimonas alkaloidigena TaxID=1075417 RepID=A0A1G9K217_9BACT|nr:MBL fold metallo-hydrolase [Catalinimonas alkaloidigena]SDL43887.1 L-ascorbate metabolism protein UlaG, beta-lactamase superfamily [Catalinimonas alkaloidigena]
MKRVLKRVLWLLVLLVLLAAVGGALFVNLAPQFGESPRGPYLERVQASPHYADGQFVNLVETRMDLGFRGGLESLWEFFTAQHTVPEVPLPVRPGLAGTHEAVPTAPLYLTWFGHSAILLELEGKRLLLDPMLGPAASPVSFSVQRFPYERALMLDSLAPVDAIFFSHDHYDHLDYPSVMALKEKTGHFFVPMGVGSHLRRWGIPDEKITELDWWESRAYAGLQVTLTPARHFSGRGLTDRNKTLWGSWAIRGQRTNVYFSGDSGYGDHFREIGERLGPFDLAMMECGQYNEKWKAIHMMPEQTLQAGLDVGGKRLMPIHWGAFALAVHPWTDPVERLTAAARERGFTELMTPVIGQRLTLEEPTSPWWEPLRAAEREE